jgi:hypothetical protein
MRAVAFAGSPVSHLSTIGSQAGAENPQLNHIDWPSRNCVFGSQMHSKLRRDCKYTCAVRAGCVSEGGCLRQKGRTGFGPKSTAIGGVVCIIKNAAVPFILVRHATLPDAYCLRGEAFLHGLMHGEYLKVNNKFGWITLL